jgi:hypothetical protein
VVDGAGAAGVVGRAGAGRVTSVWIDTDAAELASRRWVHHGEELHRAAFELEHLLHEIALGEHMAATQLLAAAATELWTTAALLRRAAHAVVIADGSFDPSAAADVVGLRAEVAAGAAGATASSAFGDPGGRGDQEVRTPYVTSGSSPVERARQRLARALADTGDARRIRADEFGLVRLDHGGFVVVLPGVIDLSVFDLGWNAHHRSVRDLDRAAFGSSRSTGVDGNPYARAVWDSLVSAGVPTGSEIMVVGHSFGADTALDLAADRRFNSTDGYRVTHVVAAGYHSVPQLSAVPADTEVLVLQNHRDVPVIAEAVGAAGVTDAAVAAVGAIAAFAALDPVAATRDQARSFGHQLRALWSATTHAVDRADDLTDVAVGLAVADPRRIGDGVVGLVTLEPGVRSPAPGQVVSVFEGGGAGFGHAPSHYASHVLDVGDPTVAAFLASVDAAGYCDPGVAIAVDVSVPR